MARILIVEDEAFIRELAHEELTDAGHDCVQARDSDEAAHILGSDPSFDVLFTDIRMPGELDGWQLAELARRRVPQIKTIFATGASETRAPSDHDQRRLLKPYRVEDILRLLDELGVA